jgi:HPt (histidine-containing phosphotransfer) domain-containing protein
MKSIDHGSRAVPTPSAPDDRFEELRDAFYVRLRADRVRLTTLAAALARAEGDPACIFDNIRLFAHRVRGAAAIFEASEIGTAAHGLEQAAGSASMVHADNSDASVWTALEILVDLLGITGGKRFPLPLAAMVRSRRHA